MARETWPCAEVIKASERVVFLAVHRHDDTDWTVRLNVLGYPQILFLDAWGQLLPGGNEHNYARTKAAVVAAVDAFAGCGSGPQPRLKLSSRLRKLVPKEDADKLTSWDCMTRIEVWRRRIPACDQKALAAIFAWETDPVARLEALRAMGKVGRGKDVIKVAIDAVGDQNDYVRQEAFALLGTLGGAEAAKALVNVIESVLGGRSGYANPNNMLCAAVEAAGKAAEPSAIESLANVLRRHTSDNYATHLAVGALAAIGSKHGRGRVRAALELALAVKGHGAERLHEAARAAMRG
ncbi:MAG: HEAT repeat domain-containing protein [Planctomycetes bacterium]|nr:HEAT repeat domain-containing protein [Planctomycetota bacterium]